MTKVAVGCDHGGFILKEAVVDELKKLGAEVVDFGCFSTESVDYPEYGLKVANVDINRKMLAELAVNDAEGFAALAEIAKKAVA